MAYGQAGYGMRPTNPLRISSSVYKMPSSTVPDAVGVAVVNLTPQEAVYVQNFADTLQQERAKDRAWDRISGATGYSPNAGGATGVIKRMPTMSDIERGIERGVVPPGWTAIFNPVNDRKEFTATDGARYYMDANSDLVQIYDLTITPTPTLSQERVLDPAARFSGLELKDDE